MKSFAEHRKNLILLCALSANFLERVVSLSGDKYVAENLNSINDTLKVLEEIRSSLPQDLDRERNHSIELDVLKFQARSALSGLSDAQIEEEQTRITNMYNGVVERYMKEIGEYLDPAIETLKRLQSICTRRLAADPSRVKSLAPVLQFRFPHNTS